MSRRYVALVRCAYEGGGTRAGSCDGKHANSAASAWKPAHDSGKIHSGMIRRYGGGENTWSVAAAYNVCVRGHVIIQSHWNAVLIIAVLRQWKVPKNISLFLCQLVCRHPSVCQSMCAAGPFHILALASRAFRDMSCTWVRHEALIMPCSPRWWWCRRAHGGGAVVSFLDLCATVATSSIFPSRVLYRC